MILEFISNINNQGSKNRIKFSTKVTISKYKHFRVLEFIEPSKGEMNRIEISDQQVNIIAGISTIELILNKKTEIIYSVKEAGNIKLTTLLNKVENNKNNIKINYSLLNKNIPIGIYDIELILKDK